MNARDGEPLNMARQKPRPASIAWVDALTATASIANEPVRLLPHLIAERARTHAQAPALLSDRESYSFAELNQRISAHARWARAHGLGSGDRVALIMSNRPAYVALWLGLSRVGIVTALINTSLTGRSLAHSLQLARPSHVIIETDFVSDFERCGIDWDAAGLAAPRVWLHASGDDDICRVNETAAEAYEQMGSDQSAPCIDDPALLIYTSGTTGLPKAAYVSHRRILNWALWFKGFLGNTEADRMYDCLPLYHSVGGVVAVA